MAALPVDEPAVMNALLQALAVGDWAFCHHPDSRRAKGGGGLPDIVAVHRRTGRLVFLEAKGPRGRPSDKQKAWLGYLAKGGHDAQIVSGANLDAVTDDLLAERHRCTRRPLKGP